VGEMNKLHLTDRKLSSSNNPYYSHPSLL